MSKCVRCGGSFLTRGRIKLADADICFKCYDALGFDHKTGIYIGKTYSWDQIKDGYDAMRSREYEMQAIKDARESGLTLKLYKQLNRVNSTPTEIKIMSAICAVLLDEGRDIDVIDAELGHNGSLMLMIDGVVFIEYKADDGVKWIRFCNEGEDKLRIGGAGRMNSLAPRIVAAYDSAAPLHIDVE